MSCCNTNKRAWRFDNPEQTTASNVLREIAGFVGTLSMSFENVVTKGYVLTPTITAGLLVSPIGLTFDTLAYDNDLTTLLIPVTLSVVGNYLFVVTVTDTVGEVFIRRSNLVIESLTGT